MSFIGRSWRGREPLWKVFWLYGIAVSLALHLVLLNARHVMDRHEFGIFLIGYGAFDLIYGFWWLVSVWKCASNVHFWLWGFLARLYIILGFLIGFLGGIGFGLAKERCQTAREAYSIDASQALYGWAAQKCSSPLLRSMQMLNPPAQPTAGGAQ